MATYVNASLTVKNSITVESGGTTSFYIEGDFDLDEMKDIVISELTNPEDVFEVADLIEWAEENGYVKEE